ncbi:sigma-54-dependent Fis family transcriptional regulator [Sporosarcina sp. P2]|uniref:sigma 54-interacting transcriptional regulator n=1 Tax=Sporosarcina sp. P2 TaxID=2048251 RepID=UPI000C167845|nr:sigma 54-interacting transcriptional regulator [Sporosarcina sp. P2]PID02516.1 sigma-54-dependent Fis family transcriptional regulator [Sporosarcina sp. P2]
MFKDTFIDTLIQFESDKKWMSVANWMNENPTVIQADKTLLEAAKVLKELKVEFLPVVDSHHRPIGMMTLHHVLEAFVNGHDKHILLETMLPLPVAEVDEQTLLSELPFDSNDARIFVVKNQQGELTGLLTQKEIFKGLSALMESYIQNEKVSDILTVILEKAFEGIAVVDEKGMIIEFNNAYSKFTGVPRSKAIGRHVTDIIENTNLHETVQKGMPERGVLQNIQGQDMVVHRIPVWKNGKVVAAIGMLIFEGVSDIYRIYERLQLQKVMNDTELPPLSSEGFSSLNQIIGTSEAISDLKRKARTAARTQAVVLLSGEKGTGKNAFAESIHQLSPLASKPFTIIHCAVQGPKKVEERLFGKGGILTSREPSTLYLQDIDRLPMTIQMKLLAFLKQAPDDFAIQLIISSTQNLHELAERDSFSSELYAQLNPLQLSIPPLRNRKEDIPYLLSHYMQEVCFSHKIAEKSFTTSAISCLMNYQWKDNIEELIDVVEDLVSVVDSASIDVTDLPKTILDQQSIYTLETVREKQDVEEKKMILDLLEKTEGNKSKTAELLGIHRTTLYKKLKKFNILT